MNTLQFRVKFQSVLGDSDAVFIGRGQVHLGDRCLTIRGLPRRLLALRRIEEVLPYARIDDVARRRRRLEFYINDNAGRGSRCLLIFRKEIEAEAAEIRVRSRMSGRHSLDRCPDNTFDVTFQPLLGRRDHRFRGRGRAAVNGDTLIIDGRTRGLLRRSERQRDVIALRRIEDVFLKDRSIRFVVIDDSGRRERRYIKLRDWRKANALCALLPRRRSARVEQAQREQRALDAYLRDARPAYVTGVLVAACIAVYIGIAVSGGAFVDLDPVLLLDNGGNFAPATASGEWWRLLSSIFLHGGLPHLVGNMVILALTGRMLEKLIGPLRFATLFIVAGLAGALVSINWSQDSVGVGASGAIFGVIGALATVLVANPQALPMKLTARVRDQMLIFGILLLFLGFLDPGVDNAAHVGGLMAGATLGPALMSRVPGLAFAYSLILALLVAAGMRSVDVIEPYRDEMAFYQVVIDLNRISEDMPATGQQINDYVEQVTRGELDESVALRFIETRMIQPWRDLDDRVRALDRLLPKSRRVRDQIKRISGGMRAYLDTQYEALRNRDEASMEENSRRFQVKLSANRT